MYASHLYLVKSDNSVSYILYSAWRTMDKTLFTRYQNNTAMFIWSGCKVTWANFYSAWDNFGRS